MKTRIAILSLAVASFATLAHAQTPPPAGGSPTPPPASPSPPPAGDAPAAAPAPYGDPMTTTDNIVKPAPVTERGAFVIGLKAGGLFSQAFSKLGASFLVDVELGYVLPYLNRGIAILLDAGYTQPTAAGTQNDPRVDAGGNMYSWDLTQRQLTFGLTLMYRATWIGSGRVAPYIGVGPRMWLLQTLTTGKAGDSTIGESTEQSTKVGVSVPIGVDIGLGPGRIFVEVQLLWAPIDHRTTGESSVGALTAGLGYRLML